MSLKTFEVNQDEFQTEVLDSATPVLVDFWAEWCGPCKMIAPIVDEIADEYADRLRVAKVDADINQDILMSYGVMSIPTLLLFQGGEPVERITGFTPKGKILNKINSHI